MVAMAIIEYVMGGAGSVPNAGPAIGMQKHSFALNLFHKNSE